MAENYGNNTGTLEVSDQSIVTNISGGDFSKVLEIFGGALATGKGTQAFCKVICFEDNRRRLQLRKF